MLCAGCWVSSAECMVQCEGFRIWNLEFRVVVEDSGFEIEGLRVSSSQCGAFLQGIFKCPSMVGVERP